MKQVNLIPFENLPPIVRYETLFKHLPPLALPTHSRGRLPFSRDNLLKALIYKALRQIKTLTDLSFEFQNNPTVCQAIGFDPFRATPSRERFSEFLRQTPHPCLQNVRIQLVKTLLEEKIISGHYLVLDSCPVPVQVRENNLKTTVKDRFDKTKIPKGDPEARLGITVTFAKSKKEVSYFWGYRNHILVDAQEELPLWEITLPANQSEIHQAIPLLQKTRETFSLNIKTVGGDAAYDTENILRFIIQDLKAQAIVPRNPRTQPTISYTCKGNEIYCPADLPMHRKGKMSPKNKGITYLQYSCPIHFGQEKQRHLLCPANHPKFTTQKGCNVLIRLTPSIRAQIDYGKEEFKTLLKKRTSVERVFSRLLAITMQDPPGVGLNTIRNCCTIAHITVLLVALVAKRSGHPDKIRFVRSFVPNFLPDGRKTIS